MKRAITAGLMSLMVVGCVQPGKRTAVGAGVGAAAGAAVGAVIGHQSGNKGQGAAIGAAVGGLLGGTIGNRLDKQARELEALAETKRTENGIITTLKSNLLYATGKADLTPAAKDSIQQISAILVKYPENRVVVIGYTDDRGADDMNQRLSERRAQSVRLAMVAEGLPASRVEAVGMGEANPVADNKTAEGRAKNRRVELQISMDEPAAK